MRETLRRPMAGLPAVARIVDRNELSSVAKLLDDSLHLRSHQRRLVPPPGIEPLFCLEAKSLENADLVNG